MQLKLILTVVAFTSAASAFATGPRNCTALVSSLISKGLCHTSDGYIRSLQEQNSRPGLMSDRRQAILAALQAVTQEMNTCFIDAVRECESGNDLFKKFTARGLCATSHGYLRTLQERNGDSGISTEEKEAISAALVAITGEINSCVTDAYQAIGF